MGEPNGGKTVERLSGAVERVAFHNDESGFCVLRVQPRGRRETVTVVGTLPEVREGEWLEAEGAWHVDPRHGEQFRAQTLRTAAPDTVLGLERYLSSGLIEGIGPKLAERLVQRFKTDILEIIEKQPRKLLSVEGIGPGRLARIRQAWAEQKNVRQIMVFLHTHGVSTDRAFRIYKTYGPAAIDMVRSDPYRLARDIRGVGFKTADQIAASLGIARRSVLRARAGVEHVLQELTNDGHCAYLRAGLVDRCERLLSIPAAVIDTAIDQAVEAERLIRSPAGGRRGELVYLAPLHRAEAGLAADLLRLARGAHPCPRIDVGKAIEWVQKRTRLTLAPEQRKAVELATRAKVLVITGGPGVGKTTLVNAILKILQAKGLKVSLCAPTGRAAKRLSETTGMPAKTIHRLLAYEPVTGQFKHHAGNPLDGDAFVVDETSMLDVVLAHQVIRAIPSHAALLLVGDVDQLPSVGPGCVLRDVIDSGAVAVCRLTEVFRQAAQSHIITNAHRVNCGKMPILPKARRGAETASDFYFVRADEPEKGQELILRLVTERIPQRFGFDAVNDIQVITPMRRGVLGARNLNLVLQRELNSSGPAIERFGWTYRAGDKVMQTINNYDKDVFNGDIGRIAALDEQQREIRVRFDGRLVRYDPRELDELALSYAITIHKSQGSEYPAVVVPIHSQHYILLQRNLLYTAITRSRRLLVLVGTERAIGLAVRRATARERVTQLKDRLAAARSSGGRSGLLPMEGA